MELLNILLIEDYLYVYVLYKFNNFGVYKYWLIIYKIFNDMFELNSRENF